MRDMMEKVYQFKVSNMWEPLQAPEIRERCNVYFSHNYRSLRKNLFKFRESIGEEKYVTIVPTE